MFHGGRLGGLRTVLRFELASSPGWSETNRRDSLMRRRSDRTTWLSAANGLSDDGALPRIDRPDTWGNRPA